MKTTRIGTGNYTAELDGFFFTITSGAFRFALGAERDDQTWRLCIANDRFEVEDWANDFWTKWECIEAIEAIVAEGII